MTDKRLTGPHAIAASMFNGHTHPLSTLANLLADHANREGMDWHEAVEFFRREADRLVAEAEDGLERRFFGV
jgi:hypothetical protein